MDNNFNILAMNPGTSEMAQSQNFQSYQTIQTQLAPPSKSIYAAFEDFEREARQRKYQITECEDMIENLQKNLDEMIASNKKLETEYLKLQSDSQAFEAVYEKNLKEKSLIENDYHNLCKEMDSATEEAALKQRKIKELQIFHATKLDQIKKVDEMFLTEYKKNPKIAQVLDYQKKNDELEAHLIDKTQEIELSKCELRDLQSQIRVEWDGFVKQCVAIAEIHADLRKKIQHRNALKKEYLCESNINSQRMPMTRNDTNIPSAFRHQLIGEQNFSKRASGLVVPRVRRTSTFREMDRILNRPILRKFTDGGIPTASPTTSFQKDLKQLTVPTLSGTFLVSELRSKLKGTVMVTPMPRNQTVGYNQAQTTNPNGNGIDGYDNREDDNIQSSQSHYFSPPLTNVQPNLASNILPTHQQIHAGKNKSDQMEVEREIEAPTKKLDAVAKCINLPNSTTEPLNKNSTMATPQLPPCAIPQQFVAQNAPLGQGTDMSVAPINRQSHPAQPSTPNSTQPFNLFGDLQKSSGPSTSFNFGASPTSNDFDFFGGLFDSNTTPQSNSSGQESNQFFSFF